MCFILIPIVIFIEGVVSDDNSDEEMQAPPPADKADA